MAKNSTKTKQDLVILVLLSAANIMNCFVNEEIMSLKMRIDIFVAITALCKINNVRKMQNDT